MREKRQLARAQRLERARFLASWPDSPPPPRSTKTNAYANGEPNTDENTSTAADKNANAKRDTNEEAIADGRLPDQRVAEGIIAENLERWKLLLDQVLEPGSAKIRRDQVTLAVAALANSARVTALPVILHLVETARFDLNINLPAADRQNGVPATHQIGEFFRSNYAGLLSLLKRGARMPARRAGAGCALREIAADAQSTHLSRVNLILKKHVQLAQTLVARLAEKPGAVISLTTELARFSPGRSENLRRTCVDELRVSQDYLIHALEERLPDAALFRVGLDVPHVREKFLDGLNVREALAREVRGEPRMQKRREKVQKYDTSSLSPFFPTDFKNPYAIDLAITYSGQISVSGNASLRL